MVVNIAGRPAAGMRCLSVCLSDATTDGMTLVFFLVFFLGRGWFREGEWEGRGNQLGIT